MNLKNMPQEELELLSYTKIAELYIQETKKPMTTADLFKEVCNLLGLGETDYQKLIADFFQSLTTSKEFILLDNGKWDLREKHIVKIHLDDDEEEDKEEENDIEDNLSDMEEELEEDYSSVDNNFVDDDEDLSELTIVDEEDLEEE
jgi:DNA-directed RNA polymerase delta subunit